MPSQTELGENTTYCIYERIFAPCVPMWEKQILATPLEIQTENMG